MSQVTALAEPLAPIGTNHSPTSLSPMQARMLWLLHGCGPQAALDLEPGRTPSLGLPESVVTVTAREAGCHPACDARRDLEALVDTGLARVSSSELPAGRYFVLEHEHGTGTRRCSITITRAGRRLMVQDGAPN